MNEKERKRRLDEAADYYETNVLKIPIDAEREHELNENKNVAGLIRHNKGNLVEELTKKLVFLACDDLKISSDRCCIEKRPVTIKIANTNYIMTRNLKNPDGNTYELEVDNVVLIDGKFVMNIESKSYTEATMLKVVLLNAILVHQHYPDAAFVLLQLENALDGNYDVGSSESENGNGSGHVVMSVFPEIYLNLLTLLDGNRSSAKPIHKPEYYKAMNKDKLRRAYSVIKKLIDERVQKDRVVSQKKVYLHDYDMDDVYKVVGKRHKVIQCSFNKRDQVRNV